MDSARKLKVIRVRKQDSALVYHLFESYEGIVGYSTLPTPSEFAAAFCDLELTIPIGFTEEVDELLRRLGDLIYELDSTGTG